MQGKVELIVVLGPTASGKTRLGVMLARELSGEIISADSRQVYRGMDIGTGKDLCEYGDVPYHLIDIVDPGYHFNLFEFQRRFLQVYEDIRSRQKLPFLVGGTGLYLESVLKGYHLAEVPENPDLRRELELLSDEELRHRLATNGPLHNTTDLIDRRRMIRAIEIAEHDVLHPPEPFPAINSLIIGVRWEREKLRQRITERLKARLQEGLIEEVEGLLQQGISPSVLDYYGLEYRFVVKHLLGELNRNDMFQKLNSAIHDFAKKQETWFLRMERNGTPIKWVAGDREPFREAMQTIKGKRDY